MELQRVKEHWTAFRRFADAKHSYLFSISIGLGATILGSAFLLFVTRSFSSKRNSNASGSSQKLALEPSHPTPVATPIISIRVPELLSGSAASSAVFCQQLRDHGFCVLQPDGDQIAALKDLLGVSGKQFFSLDQDKKGRSQEVNSIGYSTNLGYVNVKDVREYIKLRPSDPKYLWPTEPATFKPCFDRVFRFMKELSWKCFTDLAKFQVDGKQLLVQETVEILAGFVESKSSICTTISRVARTNLAALIHYYPDLPANKVACDEHRDTGLLTLIVASDVPGLEIHDKASRQWITSEQVAKPWEIICIIGEKTSTGERYSMAFLLDVAK